MHTNGYSLRSAGTNKSGQADVQTELTPTRRIMIAAGLQTGRISDQETLTIPVSAANAEVDVDMLRRPPHSDLSPPTPPHPGSQLQAQSVNRSGGCVRGVVGSFAATVFPAAQNAQSRRKEPQIELSRPSHSLLRTIGLRAGRKARVE